MLEYCVTKGSTEDQVIYISGLKDKKKTYTGCE